MKQYTFKDGTKVIASTKEEAIKKHKVVALSFNEIKSGFTKIKKFLEGTNLHFEYFDHNGISISIYSKKDYDIYANDNPFYSEGAGWYLVRTDITNNKEIFFKTPEEVIEFLKKEYKINKVTARFSTDETSRLEKCLELLEKQCAICGLKLYFELDNEKEYVNVYLKPDKKNVYLTVNVGSDSTATAMYEIWKTIYSKI